MKKYLLRVASILILISHISSERIIAKRILVETTTPTTTSETPKTTPTIQITGSQAEYQTIPNIIISIEAISTIYNIIFEGLPEAQTGAETSTLDDIQAGLETYKKVRNFVVVLSSRREELLKDIKYIRDNMGALGLTKYEVLGLYDLRSQYEKLTRNYRSYDKIFQLKDAYMDAEVVEYLEDIKAAVDAIDSILEVEKIIWDKTKFIRDQINESDTSTAVLTSIDSVLMLLLDLLEYRKKVIEKLNIAQPSILDLGYKKERFIQILTDEMIFIGIKTTENQSTGVGKLSSFVMLLLCFSFWF